ncbi:MAG: hypothetical protein HY403_07475 [Elusimicrobia bacterium]|nr:hypothetical protein [Elusimicrobiota bacterium]
MNSNLIRGVLALSFLAVAPALHAGQHVGEADKIEANVVFNGPSGQTTTDASGITYRAPQWNWQFFEPKVYPPEYRGTYPLYFVGQTMSFTVTVKNKTTQGNKSFKIRVKALNHVLETNGSPGMELAAPQEWSVDSLGPGETRTLNGSVYIAPNPNLPSGLDLTRVRIYHLNNGSPEAGFIREDVAVWCPPNAGPPHP